MWCGMGYIKKVEGVFWMCFNFYRHKFIFFVKAYSLKIYSWIWWSGLELKTCWKQRHVHTTFRKKVCPVGSLQDLLLHIIVLNVKIFVSYWFLLIFFFCFTQWEALNSYANLSFLQLHLFLFLVGKAKVFPWSSDPKSEF